MFNNAVKRYCLRTRIAKSRDRLYRTALAWCGDASIADDLVQDSLTIALQRYTQLRDPDRLNAWLYKILNNCWKQHLRKIRPTVDIEDVNLFCENDAEYGSRQLEAADHIKRAILRLPVGQRQTITLIDLAGFSYAEVAEILEIPIGTVMSRLYTSRHSLQKVLVNFHPVSHVEEKQLRRVT